MAKRTSSFFAPTVALMAYPGTGVGQVLHEPPIRVPSAVVLLVLLMLAAAGVIGLLGADRRQRRRAELRDRTA